MRPENLYIGITGPDSKANAARVATGLSNIGYRVMLGLLAGKPNSPPNRYPVKEVRRNFFDGIDGTLNLVHMCPWNSLKLLDEMREEQELVGAGCGGFQLNLDSGLPDPSLLERYKSWAPAGKGTIVLQLNRRVFSQVDEDLDTLALRLREYGPLIHYAIVDLSAGGGREMKIPFTAECLRCIEEQNPDLGLVVAGGLNENNVTHMLRPLVQLGYRPCTDIETGGRRKSNDAFHPHACIRYGRKVAGLYNNQYP